MAQKAKRYWHRICLISLWFFLLSLLAVGLAFANENQETAGDLLYRIIFSPSTVVSIVIVAGLLFVAHYRLGVLEGKMKRIDETTLTRQSHDDLCKSTTRALQAISERLKMLEEMVRSILTGGKE